MTHVSGNDPPTRYNGIMLTELNIQHLGTIVEAELHPSAGMTAITGETGAGKSMLLSALGMLSGASKVRGRSSLPDVASWAQGVFSSDSDKELGAGFDAAKEHGIDPEEGELWLARSLPSKGRGRLTINSKPVQRSVMEDVGKNLVVIHGQSDQIRLSSPSLQLALLDDFAKNEKALSSYMEAHRGVMEARKAIDALRNPESLRRADYLRDSIASIEKANLHDGEREELRESIESMETMEERREAVSAALSLLDGTEETDGLIDALKTLSGMLSSLGLSDDAESIMASLSSLRGSVEDAASGIEDFDLDAANARISIIERLMKRFGGSEKEVLSWCEEAKAELAGIDGSEEAIAAKEKELKALETKEKSAAQALTKRRKEAAMKLVKKVNGELKSLNMEGSEFIVSITPASASKKDGWDDVSFLFRPYATADPLPLGSGASGGETSRLMLAIEVSVAHHEGMTFVFDEVDAGIGAGTAVKVAQRLKRLSMEAQVIVVTHLAQVASHADTQYVVSKEGDASHPVTTVHEVKDGEQVREIARMLSGEESEESLRHAQSLLDSSHKSA